MGWDIYLKYNRLWCPLSLTMIPPIWMNSPLSPNSPPIKIHWPVAEWGLLLPGGSCRIYSASLRKRKIKKTKGSKTWKSGSATLERKSASNRFRETWSAKVSNNRWRIGKWWSAHSSPRPTPPLAPKGISASSSKARQRTLKRWSPRGNSWKRLSKKRSKRQLTGQILTKASEETHRKVKKQCINDYMLSKIKRLPLSTWSLITLLSQS